MRGFKKDSQITEIIIDEERVLVSDNPERIAENFNEYFNQVPVKLVEKLRENAEDIDDQDGSRQNIRENHDEETGRRLSGFTLIESDVEQAINQLNNKKSTGLDNVTSSLLKKNAKFFAKILTPLFNLSLKFGHVPDQLKETIIVPVYKQGEKNLVENYRPIALLNIFSKVSERSVKNKLMNYLEHINYFSPNQYGFLRNKSTDTALFNHIQDITASIEKNKATLEIYLDLAFDTISHVKMIDTLRNIGMERSLLGWFKSYLEKRMYRVKINEVYSEGKIYEGGGCPRAVSWALSCLTSI